MLIEEIYQKVYAEQEDAHLDDFAISDDLSVLLESKPDWAKTRVLQRIPLLYQTVNRSAYIVDEGANKWNIKSLYKTC